jgi:uncharacterized protein (TIGR02266 family)
VPEGGQGKGKAAVGGQRVPLVRKCQLSFPDGRTTSAFIVNVSVVGAYLAMDEAPELGERLSVGFTFPGNSFEIQADSSVVWLNPRQQHPVHSLPPGVGVKFEKLSGADRARIEAFVREYIAGRPPRR